MRVEELITLLNRVDKDAEVVIKTDCPHRFYGNYTIDSLDIFSSANYVYLSSKEINEEFTMANDDIEDLEEKIEELEEED